MKKFYHIFFALAAAAVLLITGCATPKSNDYSAGSAEVISDAVEAFAPAESNGGKSVALLPEGRKIIRNASLSIQTLEFDSLISALNERLSSLGGYVESSRVNGRGYSSASLRYANMVLRVPSDKLDEFLNSIGSLANVTERSENVSDVTGEYVDTEAHIASLQTEYDTLLELLSKAESLDNILILQERLSEIRYKLESYKAQKQTYDEQISYSTVSLDISEVERETVLEKETFGAEVSRRFSESLSDVGSGLRDFAAWLFGDSPRILLTLAIIAFIALALRFIIRRLGGESVVRKKKAGKKSEANSEINPK